MHIPLRLESIHGFDFRADGLLRDTAHAVCARTDGVLRLGGHGATVATNGAGVRGGIVGPEAWGWGEVEGGEGTGFSEEMTKEKGQLVLCQGHRRVWVLRTGWAWPRDHRMRLGEERELGPWARMVSARLLGFRDARLPFPLRM